MRNLRVAGFVIVVLVVLVVIGSLTDTRKDAPPYDPTSSAPMGTKAFVQLIEHFGATVSVPDSFPPAATDVAVIFVEPDAPNRLDDIRDWVAEGHTLVVTTPESELTPEASVGSSAAPGSSQQLLPQGSCPVEALADVRTLDRGTTGTFVDLYQVPISATSCFGDGTDAFLVVQPVGQGQIVSIVGGAVFTNTYLDEQDNAALATALFAPRPGTRVAIIDEAFGDASGGGSVDTVGSLGQVLGAGVKLAVLQLAVAVVLYGFSRGRRLGAPITEPQPVQIAGSDLIVAVGSLLQQTRQPGNAAAILRRDLRRDVCRRLGLPDAAPADVIAESVASRTAFDRDTAVRILADHPPANDAELVLLAHQIDTLREEVLHGHAP